MYFPYLRGKQNELLAIRELAAEGIIGESVRPIIEPVKVNLSSGMPRLMEALSGKNIVPLVILNPKVGEIAEDQHGVSTVSDFFFDSKFNYEPTLLLDSVEGFEHQVSQHQAVLEKTGRFAVVAPGGPGVETLQTARKILDNQNLVPSTLVVAAQSYSRVKRAWDTSELVTLVDPFKPEDRNADYVNNGEEEFSDEYFYFSDDGWNGVSDHQTIGAGWTVGGFTPRVVAIHWTYKDPQVDRIMIRHFTSGGVESLQGDVASKFLTAAQHLVRFLDAHRIPDTLGSRQIRRHVENETFPGLGPVKKFSIENHIELIARVAES